MIKMPGMVASQIAKEKIEHDKVKLEKPKK